VTDVSTTGGLTAEQAGREHALLKAALLDFACVGMLLTIGIGADSLTNLAEGIRGGLMTLIDLVALAVLRRLHRGTLSGFDFGTGKIEQLVSIAIALSLLGGALWVGMEAVQTALTGQSEATPLGLSLAAVSGAINFFANVVAWENVRQAARGRPSAIMRAQLRARTTKLFCSVVVQITMTVAAVAKDPVIVAGADSLGALLVCGVMARAAWELVVQAVPDLLDRSTNHIAGPALQRAAGALPEGFRLESFRSRGTRHAFVLEVALACAPGTDVAAAQRAEHSLAAALAAALPETQLSLVVQAVPTTP
jgi:divalent metal cation (Fe/Co/Zn/Cd) transporter